MEIDSDTKHPTVLNAGHNFVKLFLRHTHLKNHHQGIDYFRSKLQERYAILKLRSALRSIKSNSILCRKFCAATIQPIIADLPNERLAYQSPPLTNTGVDYFGPFYVNVRRTTEKRWGFLFTCFTTLAVHVEIVPSMDTSSCVMGVERFVSRRGTPFMIWSDNGRTSLKRRKSSVKLLKNGTRSASPRNLHIRALGYPLRRRTHVVRIARPPTHLASTFLPTFSSGPEEVTA